MTHHHVENCLYCDSNATAVLSYEEKISAGRRKISVPDLLITTCSACGESFATMEQLDHNRALLKEASRNKQGAIFPGLLRSLRQRWGLTQTACSQLFAAGPKAVAKWESGQVPSGPSALLVQCAVHVPGVMDYLGRLGGVTLVESETEPVWDSKTVVAPEVTPTQSYSRPRIACVAKPRVQATVVEYRSTTVELYGEAA